MIDDYLDFCKYVEVSLTHSSYMHGGLSDKTVVISLSLQRLSA